jgi:predicted Zn-dependent protease
MLAAMGATGGTEPSSPPVPNYVSKLDHKVSWSTFPLKVHFKRDPEYTAERELQAIAGFRQWETASRGLIQLAVVELPSAADVVVQFDPESSNGATTNTFSRGQMVRADIKLGVQRGRRSDLECVAAHEFGHALGITGHSDDRKDLMYPYHWMGKGCGISRRDLNTLAARYPAIAERIEWRHSEL